MLSITASVPPAIASSSTTPGSIPQTCHLEPLILGQPGFVYLEKGHRGVQYSFRVTGDTQEEKLKATERYREVKGEVTILLAALLHSLESFRTLSRPIRLSSSNGFYLECSCVRAGKLGRAWEWTKRGQTIEMVDVKLRFEFGVT